MKTEQTTQTVTQTYKKRSQVSAVWRRLKKNKLAMLGLFILFILIGLAVFADFIADYDTVVVGLDMSQRLLTPRLEHIFGTDQFGRDVFARIIHGGRLSLSLSIISMSVAVAIGACIGAVAGYYGGRVDDVLMRLMDILLAIPPMLMSISIVAALCAVRLCPRAEAAIFASHASSEPAARRAMEALGKRPLITAGMHLGEGTGAVASIPLWDMALAVYQGCYSFAEGGIAPYTPQC